MLVLERLSDARRLGHQVLAVIRGSAVNQDGASSGLTAPNGPSQQRLIRAALANANLPADGIDAVEAHGTGTKLGDPIEAQALLATYGQDRTQPLWLGSIKSNIGHAQAAAGAAGVIKMVMAMRHGILPKTLHIEQPTPQVDWDSGNVTLLTEAVSWPHTERPRRAAVSSFGISGTNAHIIIEQPTPTTPAATTPDTPTTATKNAPIIWPISARTRDALHAYAHQIHHYAQHNPDVSPHDIAAALAARAHLPHRAAVIAHTRDDLLHQLHTLATTGTPATPTPTTATTTGTATTHPKTAFLFTGQGAQQPGMGHDLYHTYPTFADTLDTICQHFDPHLPHPLRDILLTDTHHHLIHQTAYTQPALFALEAALYHLIRSWDIQPDYLLGHSIGELTAAYAAGILTLPDACTLVAARAQLMQTMPTNGAMISIQATPDEITPHLTQYHNRLSIAAINTPTTTVISGDHDAATHLATTFTNQGRKTKKLNTSHAFHSPHTDTILDAFHHTAKQLTYHPPHTPIISNLTGKPADPHHICTPEYWTQHIRQPVQYANAIHHLHHTAGITTYLELGPDNTLTTLTQHNLPNTTKPTTTLPTLNPKQPEPITLTTTTTQTWTHGTHTNLHTLTNTTPTHPTPPLPTYPFQRQRLWVDRRSSIVDVGRLGLTSADHPLLDTVTALADAGGIVFAGRLSVTTQPWIADHRASGTAVLPAAAFVEFAVRAADEVGCERVEELTLEAPLLLPEHGALQLQVAVGAADGSGRRPLSVHSRPADGPTDGVWIRHASGTLMPISERPVSQALPTETSAAWPPPDAQAVRVDDLYDELADRGITYGPALRGLSAVWKRGSEVFAEATLPASEAAAANRFGLHPALLDAALRAAGAGSFMAGEDIWVPFRWSGVSLLASGATEIRVRIAPAGPDRLSLEVAGADGQPIARVEAVSLRSAPAEAMAAPGQRASSSVFAVAWTPLAVKPADPASTVVVLRGSDAADQLAATPEADVAVPDAAVLICRPRSAADVAEAADITECAQASMSGVERTVQVWLDQPRLDDCPLIVVTSNAVAAESGDDVLDPGLAAVGGLVRAMQAECPRRLILLDVDAPDDADWQSLLPAVLAADEPHLAVRADRLLAPRLVRPTPLPSGEPHTLGQPDGSALILGGRRSPAAALARHILESGQAHQVFLLNAEALDAASADPAADPDPRIVEVPGDPTDPESLDRALATASPEHPLTTVVYLADLASDEPPRASAARQIAAALRTHELTMDLGLAAFVLVSPGSAALAAAEVTSPTRPARCRTSTTVRRPGALRMRVSRSPSALSSTPLPANGTPAVCPAVRSLPTRMRCRRCGTRCSPRRSRCSSPPAWTSPRCAPRPPPDDFRRCGGDWSAPRPNRRAEPPRHRIWPSCSPRWPPTTSIGRCGTWYARTLPRRWATLRRARSNSTGGSWTSGSTR